MLRWTRHIGIVFLLLFGGMGFLCPSAYAEIKTGNCGADGDNVKYSLNTDTKVMRIYGTGAMKNVTTTNFLTAIPWYFNSSSVKSIVIEEGVTQIGSYIFMFCSNLTSVSIPNTVHTIKGGAFNGCGNLTSVTIPTSVSVIEDNAFASTGLADVYVGWTEAPLPTFVGLPTNQAITVHVPCGTTDLYEATDGWKDYDIEKTRPTVTVTTDDDSMGTVEITVND